MSLKHDDVQRLEEIKDEIKELVSEAKRLLRESGDRIEQERAKSYWIAHILGALDKEHDYMGGSMFTMQDTIDHLWGDVPEDDEDEEVEEDG